MDLGPTCVLYLSTVSLEVHVLLCTEGVLIAGLSVVFVGSMFIVAAILTVVLLSRT